MTIDLLPHERELIDQVPERDLAEMAVDLDVLLDAEIDREGLLQQCLAALLDRAAQEGLPFSKYDAEDLHALSAAEREALGTHMGVRGRVTVKALLRQGAKTWRIYKKQRPKSSTALLVPLLLGPLARGAMARQGRQLT